MAQKMTKEQEKHLSKIIATFVLLADKKYRAGQAEHGSNLFDMATEMLIDEALNEAIDQFVYLTTLKEKLKNDKAQKQN